MDTQQKRFQIFRYRAGVGCFPPKTPSKPNPKTPTKKGIKNAQKNQISIRLRIMFIIFSLSTILMADVEHMGVQYSEDILKIKKVERIDNLSNLIFNNYQDIKIILKNDSNQSINNLKIFISFSDKKIVCILKFLK